MRINIGLAYKRRQRNAKKQAAKKEIVRMCKRCYRGDLSPDAYLEEYWNDTFHKAGMYTKKNFYSNKSSAKRYSFYPMKDIRNAINALSAYDEYELPENIINREEARIVRPRY